MSRLLVFSEEQLESVSYRVVGGIRLKLLRQLITLRNQLAKYRELFGQLPDDVLTTTYTEQCVFQAFPYLEKAEYRAMKADENKEAMKRRLYVAEQIVLDYRERYGRLETDRLNLERQQKERLAA